jgi:sugar lactone lactonase YvrE
MEVIFYAGSTLLEGPVWDAKNKLIYCVSIEQGLIYQINSINGAVQTFATEGSVGCVALDKDGFIVSAEKGGIYRTNPNTGEKMFLTQLETDERLRYNDGRLDPTGRFLVGTKSEKDFFEEIEVVKGNLFSFNSTTDSCKVLLKNLEISNGIGFSAKGDKMYFIDTPSRKVAQYSYDLKTGDISFDKYIVFVDGEGWPDGMCVDLDGNIWVAEWEGGRVRKWNISTGEVMQDISVPCARVTSCCLGGDNLRDLYITTARGSKGNLGGALFKYTLR